MTSINPVETQVQTPAFKGFKKCLKAITENKEEIKQLGERIDKQNATLEAISGLATAYQVKDPAKLKEMVMKETALGHFDFVRSINEYLAKNASKEIYKK